MLKLTKTMIEKSIIDANAEVRTYALTLGIDYEKMVRGEKVVVPAKLPNGEDTEVRFYRTGGARMDRRVSIKNLRKFAAIGDTITLVGHDRACIMVIPS